jgi:hypothetical protein
VSSPKFLATGPPFSLVCIARANKQATQSSSSSFESTPRRSVVKELRPQSIDDELSDLQALLGGGE